MSTGLVGLHACVADLHPDAIIHVHTHDSYIRVDMSHRCDLLPAESGAPQARQAPEVVWRVRDSMIYAYATSPSDVE